MRTAHTVMAAYWHPGAIQSPDCDLEGLTQNRRTAGTNPSELEPLVRVYIGVAPPFGGLSRQRYPTCVLQARQKNYFHAFALS